MELTVFFNCCQNVSLKKKVLNAYCQILSLHFIRLSHLKSDVEIIPPHVSWNEPQLPIMDHQQRMIFLRFKSN